MPQSGIANLKKDLIAAAAGLPSYLRRYGIVPGTLAKAKIEWARGRHQPFVMAPLPHSRDCVQLRSGHPDVAVFNQIFIRGDYDISNLRQAERFNASQGDGMLIVDCGANIGCSAIWFARRYPRAKVVAIEPEAGNFEQLQRNTASYPNIELVRAGVWSVPCDLAITNPRAPSWAFRMGQVQAGTAAAGAIPAVTLDAILGRYREMSSVIVKIDIEGAERDVFASNTDWLQHVDLLIIELHDAILPWAQTARPVLARLVQFPMDFVFRGENLFCFRHRVAGVGAARWLS